MIAIYIAGPFRGKTPWEVEQNVHDAELAAMEVARLGYVPLCPHTMYRHFDGELTDQFWLEATIDLLLRCDGALFLPSWERSAGSKGEMAAARTMGEDVFPVFAKATWAESLAELIAHEFK